MSARCWVELGDPQTHLLEPVPAPRMTKSSRWSLEPGVLRYKAFCKEVRRRGIALPVPFAVQFFLPMPKSWSSMTSETRILDSHLDGMPHERKPDADNLLKGLIDAVHWRKQGGDSHVHSFVVGKFYSIEGHFIVWPVLRLHWPNDIRSTDD